MSIRALNSIIAASLLAAIFNLPVQAAENPALTQAVQDYNAKKYRDAITKLDNLSRSGQANDKSHYYMALCYQAINQMATAKNEYMWVYSNGKDAKLRYNAWQALMSMDKWSQHRAYQGNGNEFSRLSPTNTAGEQFRQQKLAEDAAVRRSSGSG